MIGEHPICINCKNFNELLFLNFEHKCKAFEKIEIPEEIWSGENNHTKPLPDQDNDIVFEPII